jgi:CDP-diacylglycerol--serine O-phosphatidyltransferase
LKAASEEGAGKDKRYSEGLTITCAGGMVSALVLHHSKVRATEVDNTLAVLLLTLMLSYLMISTVRFRSWRSLRISPASVVLLAVSMAAAVVILAVYDVTMLLVAIGGGYIGFGLLEEAFHLTRRRRDDDLYYLSESPVPDGEEGAEDEEEEARA